MSGSIRSSLAPPPMPSLAELVNATRRAKLVSFDLLRWFSVVSLVVIALVSTAMATFLTRFLESHMLERDAVVSMEFINGVVRADGMWPSFEAPNGDSEGRAIGVFFNHVANLPAVMRANVYGGDRTVIWSSTQSLIGQRFDDNHELEEAFSGDIAIESGEIGRAEKAEHIAFDADAHGTRFVEAYLPIWSQDHTAVIGVVEIYKLPRALFDAIDEGVFLVRSTAAAGAVLLFLALFGIVRRGANIIREQQQKLLQAETLSAIGEMASAVAHGIRNPLAAIRSSAEVARGEEDRLVADECLADVIRQTERLDRWVRDLLHARSEQATAEQVDLAKLLRDSLEAFSTSIARQAVRVEVDVSALPPVRANPGSLTQAFHTIVANAIEAMPNGGALSISARRAERKVEIRIADTGRGLAAAEARRVFRPFFTTKPNGLGLGLALAQRIIERYSGSISFSSVEGEGTTVTVSIPVAG
jgi:two-component system, NtrC family, sensor histidine kinase HydH